MPPRKSDASKAGDDVVASTPNAKNTTPAASAATPDQNGPGIEELGLPKSIVTRLAKSSIPPGTQIQGNALVALSKSATVFASYLSTHANDYAQAANRKTITPADVFDALSDIEFPNFKPRLEAELIVFNKNLAEKKKKIKNKGAEASTEADKEGIPDTQETEAEPTQDGQPASKKPRHTKDEGDAEPDADETEEETQPDAESDDEEDDVVEEGDEDEGNEASDIHDEGEADNDEAEEEEDEALDNGEDSD